MSQLIIHGFATWLEFFIVTLIGLFLLFFVDRFHLFKRHSWETSIGYHMFFCAIILIITITFVAVNPLYHFIILVIIFWFLYRNIAGYVKSIFNLYFSRIHIGDQIQIGETKGVLSNINLGGMHITSNNHKAFYPFANWKGEKIVLLSVAGKVAVSFVINDDKNRTDHKGIYALEKSLFNFPFLVNEKISITSLNDELVVRAMISNKNMRESLKSNIQKAGFSINEINK